MYNTIEGLKTEVNEIPTKKSRYFIEHIKIQKNEKTLAGLGLVQTSNFTCAESNY